MGNNSSSGMIMNSYFNTETSSQTDAIGGGTTTGSGITNVSGKTTTEAANATAGTAMDIYANWNIDVDNGQPIGVDDGTAAGDPTADDPWDFGTEYAVSCTFGWTLIEAARPLQLSLGRSLVLHLLRHLMRLLP